MRLAQAQVLIPAVTQQPEGPWTHDSSKQKKVEQRHSFELDFNSYYDQHLKQPVANYIAKNKENSASSNTLFWGLIAIVVATGLGIGAFGLPDYVSNHWLIIIGVIYKIFPFAFVLAALLFVFWNKIRSWFSKKKPENQQNIDLNSIIIPQIFRYLDNGCTYNRQATLGHDELDRLGINFAGRRVHCQDEIYGERNGINFQMMEVKIEKAKEASSFVMNQFVRELTKVRLNHTVYETVFKGVYLLIDVPKPFSGRVEVKRDSKLYFKAITNTFSKMKRVRLEDPEFEKAFEVYADDQVEARCLLTTTLMQSLNELRFLLGGSSLEASFYDGKLSLMIDCPFNLFDVSPDLEEEEYREEAKKVIGDLNSIFKAIDAMDLNTQRIV